MVIWNRPAAVRESSVGPVIDLSWVTSGRYLLVRLGGTAGESGRLVVVEVAP